MLPRLSGPKSPRAAERSRYIAAAKPFGFRGVGLYFQSKVADALVRNDLRPAEQGGPLVGVLGTYKRLQVPEARGGLRRAVLRPAGAGRFHRGGGAT
ncbi:hypothetical protein [Corallococcus sp. RDP092CA]|uniref:hypothetical protein n=1 Tax=Corallococcus sp. RDP092CA TaxID=3109369 RepID=UPI0035B3BEA4